MYSLSMACFTMNSTGVNLVVYFIHPLCFIVQKPQSVQEEVVIIISESYHVMYYVISRQNFQERNAKEMSLLDKITFSCQRMNTGVTIIL